MTGPPAVDEAAWGVRAHIYRRLEASGRAPTPAEVATALATTEDEVRRSLSQLAAAHVLALQAESGEVWMAHPFSAVPTPFVVRSGSSRYFANCAWDAIALPMLLGRDGITETTCPESGERIPLEVRGGDLAPVPDAVVRFPVPARDFWIDIGYT